MTELPDRARALLEPAAEALFAAAHGVNPGDLTYGPGRASAHAEYLPFLTALAQPIFELGFDAAVEQDMIQRSDPTHPFTRLNPFGQFTRPELPKVPERGTFT